MEIERKFLCRNLPDLNNYTPIHTERYYLTSLPGQERRIQKKNEKYELEELKEDSSLSRSVDRREIAVEDFEKLKQGSEGRPIIRDSYHISDNPKISIQIYQGEFKGLIRVEVEFKSEAEARTFEPSTWFGEEITESPLGRDSKLVKLSEEEFKKLSNVN